MGRQVEVISKLMLGDCPDAEAGGEENSMEITAGREGIARIGEWVKHKKKMRKVIGYAIGEDGRDCYVTSSAADSDGWSTYLVPIDEVTRKFVEVDIGVDTVALEPCDGCIVSKDESEGWRCVGCVRRQRDDNFKAAEAGE